MKLVMEAGPGHIV